MKNAHNNNRNPFTKKAARLALSYLHATATCLREAYRTYSDEKYNAEKAIQMLDMPRYNGRDYRVTGASSFAFTCAYVYADKKTGELMLRTHTKDNAYDTPLMDERTAQEILAA